MSKVILSCLLLVFDGCAGPHAESRYSFVVNSTEGKYFTTCTHNMLKEMDIKTKTWIFYDGLPHE
jgi:hypothetical protein